MEGPTLSVWCRVLCCTYRWVMLLFYWCCCYSLHKQPYVPDTRCCAVRYSSLRCGILALSWWYVLVTLLLLRHPFYSVVTCCRACKPACDTFDVYVLYFRRYKTSVYAFLRYLCSFWWRFMWTVVTALLISVLLLCSKYDEFCSVMLYYLFIRRLPLHWRTVACGTCSRITRHTTICCGMTILLSWLDCTVCRNNGGAAHPFVKRPGRPVVTPVGDKPHLPLPCRDDACSSSPAHFSCCSF